MKLDMKITQKDIRLLLVLAGVLILLVTYLSVYQPLTERTEALETQVEELQPKLEQMREFASNLEKYRAETASIKQQIVEQLQHYPNAVRTEDEIMYAKQLEDSIGLSISKAEFNPAELLYQWNGIADEDSAYEVVPLNGYRKTITYADRMTYQQMKKLIPFIYKTQDATAIDSLTVNYDSDTGGLSGTLVLAKYYITGLDDTYYATDVGKVAYGSSNLFQSK